MLKPIVKDKKITSFVILDYKKNIEKKLATTHQTFIYIMFIVIFILFISIVMTLVFALQITNPIGELIAGINVISKGDKSYKIDISTDDEISILANSFNHMIEAINKHQNDIENLNNSLEEKVRLEVKKNIEKDKQLIEQSRLAQMGEMISMIAHQWRQPLAAISSTSTGIILKAKLNKLNNDIAIESASKISDYSQHLSSTINDFRDFFKPNKEAQNTTYNELIQSVLSIVEVSITNKNIALIKNLNCQDTFYSYPSEIKQVLLNIIKNAEDILIENKIDNPQIKIETNCRELSISDNGGGVPEDIIDKIFDPYFSTKLGKNGTGLGLYMSKTIIEEHCEGTLSVCNEKDGAKFSIFLPLNFTKEEAS